ALGGKNMLSQEAQSTTYKVISATDLTPAAVVSSSVQLWSDQIPVLGSGSLGTTGPQSGVWRKKSNYVFIGNSEQAMAANGLIAASSFTPFTNWTTGEPPSQWQKTSEVTLYDPNSHAIEAKDINENFAATKFTSDHSQVIASAANARYTEFAYCGGEENTTSAGGGVTVNGTRVPTAHTGLFGVQAAVNSRAFSFTLTPSARDYVVNVWATQPDAFVRFKVGTVTSTATTQRLGKAGNWHLLQATLTATSTQPIEVWVEAKGATTQFDDFRVHPLTGPMTSYVYNSFGELSHILDASNLFTEFRYDAMGRLTQTYRETLLGPGDQPRYGASGIAKVSDIQYN
ncbi:MAG: RHS repeat domain-containing protein, partial [Cyclobacteriaceae bacterium]